MEGSRMPGWGVQESFGLLTNFKVVVPVKHQQTDTSGARDAEMDPRTLVHFFLESSWLVSSTVKGTGLLGRAVSSWKALESKDTSCNLTDFFGGH